MEKPAVLSLCRREEMTMNNRIFDDVKVICTPSRGIAPDCLHCRYVPGDLMEEPEASMWCGTGDCMAHDESSISCACFTEEV